MSTQFYVHMVESPSSRDILAGDLEGRVLYQALTLTGIEATYSLTVDRDAFRESLGPRLVSKIQADQFMRWPIVHLSAHGRHDGLVLTNTDHFFSWFELMNAFRALNRALQGRLILAVSSCYGGFAALEALSPGDDPFFALVGPNDSLPVSDLAIGFSAFYHVLAKTWDLTKAHTAMCVASENESFQLHIGEQLRQVRLRRQVDQILSQMANEGIPSTPFTDPGSAS